MINRGEYNRNGGRIVMAYGWQKRRTKAHIHRELESETHIMHDANFAWRYLIWHSHLFKKHIIYIYIYIYRLLEFQIWGVGKALKYHKIYSIFFYYFRSSMSIIMGDYINNSQKGREKWGKRRWCDLFDPKPTIHNP